MLGGRRAFTNVCKFEQLQAVSQTKYFEQSRDIENINEMKKE